MFVLLSFFVWALSCLLFFHLWLLITLLLSSNSSDLVGRLSLWYLQTLLILWARIIPLAVLFCRVICHFSYLWFLIFKEIEIISGVVLTFWKVAAIKLSGQTWWRWFLKHVVLTKLDIYLFCLLTIMCKTVTINWSIGEKFLSNATFNDKHKDIHNRVCSCKTQFRWINLCFDKWKHIYYT